MASSPVSTAVLAGALDLTVFRAVWVQDLKDKYPANKDTNRGDLPATKSFDEQLKEDIEVVRISHETAGSAVSKAVERSALDLTNYREEWKEEIEAKYPNAKPWNLPTITKFSEAYKQDLAEVQAAHHEATMLRGLSNLDKLRSRRDRKHADAVRCSSRTQGKDLPAADKTTTELGKKLSNVLDSPGSEGKADVKYPYLVARKPGKKLLQLDAKTKLWVWDYN